MERENLLESRVSTLRNLSYIKISTVIWSSSDVIAKIKLYPKWDDVNMFALSQFRQLNLSHKRQGKKLQYHIGQNLQKWLNWYLNPPANRMFLAISMSVVYTYLSHLRWTNQGTVDHREMAATMIKDELLHFEKRFRLACYFNLLEEIPDLWRKARPLEYQRETLFGLHHSEPLLINYWIHNMEGELVLLMDNVIKTKKIATSLHREIVLEAARNGTEASLQYFWEKLDSKERVLVLNELKGCEVSSELVQFCVKNLSFILKERAVADLGSELLFKLLVWPFQHMFKRVALEMLDWIDGITFSSLLTRVMFWSKKYPCDRSYRSFLVAIWAKSRFHLRLYLVERVTDLLKLLSDLMELRYTTFTGMVLSDVYKFNKGKWLVRKAAAPKIFLPLIANNRWELLPYFFTVFTPTSEDARKAYYEVVSEIANHGNGELKHQWYMYGSRLFYCEIIANESFNL